MKITLVFKRAAFDEISGNVADILDQGTGPARRINRSAKERLQCRRCRQNSSTDFMIAAAIVGWVTELT